MLTKIPITRSWKIISVSRKYTTMNQADMLKSITGCIPDLNTSKHKGQAGRIGIVGGSLEYTGAPYFAGISALKVGADLVHIFCTAPAATVIKSYSPELIVHPILKEKNVAQISPWLDRIHVMVIGPGLGRDPSTFEVVSELIQIIKQKNIPLVVDADGLFLITENLDLIKNFSSPIVLTPNKIEFERLYNKVGGVDGLHQLGNNVIILKKGPKDETLCSITDVQWKDNLFEGSGRRCGGQGDLLSGSIATFLHWILNNIDNIDIKTENKTMAAVSLACYAASNLIRLCNEKAFKCKGRSMLASDMVEFIHESFEQLYGE